MVGRKYYFPYLLVSTHIIFFVGWMFIRSCADLVPICSILFSYLSLVWFFLCIVFFYLSVVLVYISVRLLLLPMFTQFFCVLIYHCVCIHLVTWWKGWWIGRVMIVFQLLLQTIDLILEAFNLSVKVVGDGSGDGKDINLLSYYVTE